MERLLQPIKNLISYMKSVQARKEREKKEKEEDPYIYPHF